jgi:hypothetical protein
MVNSHHYISNLPVKCHWHVIMDILYHGSCNYSNIKMIIRDKKKCENEGSQIFYSYFPYKIGQLINEIGNRSSELLQCEIVATFLFIYKIEPPYYSSRIYENHSFPMRKSTSLLFQNEKRYQSIIPIQISTNLLFQYEKVPVYYSIAKKYQSIIPIQISTSLLFLCTQIPVYYSNTKKYQSIIPIRKSTVYYSNTKLYQSIIPIRKSSSLLFQCEKYQSIIPCE